MAKTCPTRKVRTNKKPGPKTVKVPAHTRTKPKKIKCK